MTGTDSQGLVIASLRSTPLSIQQARRTAVDGGLPLSPGFYAWWSVAGAIAQVPWVPHPLDDSLGLFYVGVSPASASSSQTLRTRVINNHLSGNLGSSTFRFTLAALLSERLKLHPEGRAAKIALPRTENKRLSEWQTLNLKITWCVHAEPWRIEPEVITAMQAPLNLAGNSDHPFHATLARARDDLRTAARASASQPNAGSWPK